MFDIPMLIHRISTLMDRHGSAVITLLTYVGYVNFLAIPQGLVLGGNNALTAASLLYPGMSLILYAIKAHQLQVARGIVARYHEGGRILTPSEEVALKILNNAKMNDAVSFYCLALSMLQLGILFMPRGG